LDRDSAVVYSAVIAVWVAVWVTTGLHRYHSPLFVAIFTAFIGYCILAFITSDTKSGGVVYELNILLTVEQMISILFGTVVLFAVFADRLEAPASCKSVIYRLTMSNVVILCMASMWVNVYTSGHMFKALRKFKQGIYNIALIVFMLVAILYVRGGECPSGL
jgi:hypothetical protein